MVNGVALARQILYLAQDFGMFEIQISVYFCVLEPVSEYRQIESVQAHPPGRHARANAKSGDRVQVDPTYNFAVEATVRVGSAS